MANDILTNVEQARKEVLDIVAAYGIQNDERGPFAQYVDALIAAVRAEPSFDQRAQWFKAGRQSAFDWLVQQAIEAFPGRYTSTAPVSTDEPPR